MSVIDWSKCPAVEKRPDITTGFYVFKGTKVPLVKFFNSLSMGFGTGAFLEFNPSVPRDELHAVLSFLTVHSAT
jgi:uncharacterized protein (DUF433 family)